VTSDLEESGGGRQPIDWLSLSEEMGLITWYEEGRNESGGTREAREAIARILGDDEMRAAVDYYVSGAPGSELARSVLWLLHPVAAMDRCVEIFRSDADIEDRRSAVHLLEVAADTRTLELVPEFLADPDDVIPMWGIGIVDQLMISNLVDFEDVRTLLSMAEEHPNPRVRHVARSVIEAFGEDNS